MDDPMEVHRKNVYPDCIKFYDHLGLMMIANRYWIANMFEDYLTERGFTVTLEGF